jgi:hypothetical protein
MTKLLTTTAVILAVFAAVPAQAATSGKGLIKKDLARGNLVRVALVKKVVIKKDLIRTPRILIAKTKRVAVEKEAAPAKLAKRRIIER